MIIVSQDKDMIVNMDNVYSIWIENPLENDNGKFSIETTGEINATLGYYETEERAKDVLQEMINTYKNTDIEAEITGMNRERVAVGLSPINTQSKSKSYNFKIYEMPEN